MGHIYDRYFRFEIIFKKERRVVNIFSTILQYTIIRINLSNKD